MTSERASPRELEEFLTSRPGRSQSTKKLYRIVLMHLLDFTEKDPNILDVEDIQRFLQHLEEKHSYKKNTLRAYVSILRSFLRFLNRVELRAHIQAVRAPKSLPIVPTPEEIERMIDVTDTLRDKMIVQMLARTGLRVGELCNLDVRNIDFQNLRIVVRSQEAWKPKGGKERVVRMDSETAALIQKHIGSRGQGRLIDVTSSTIRAMIKRVARKASVRNAEQITPHKLRHFLLQFSTTWWRSS